MRFWFSVFAVACMSSGAFADPSVELNGTDISAAVKYFAPMVTSLTKSVTVYNWSPNDAQFGRTSDLSEAAGHSRRFWKMYGTSAPDLYGTGLYAATDPYLTYSYGGSNWRVMVLQLPVGFKLLDLIRSASAYGNQRPPPAVAAILSQFGCPVSSSPEPFFNTGGVSLSPLCQSLVKSIFSDHLNIDGFAYSYGQTQFADCQKNTENGNRAFVITNDDWITPTNFHYYTTASREDMDERIIIETLFLQAGQQYQPSADPGSAISGIEDYLDAHPDSDLVSSKSVCKDTTCVVTVHFCNAKNFCEDRDLPALPRPGGAKITALEAARGSQTQSLLWSDLEGQPKSTTLSVYLKKTQFGCDGTLPYDTSH